MRIRRGCAVAIVEELLERAEGDFASCRALRGEVRLLAEINKDAVVPDIHLDDAPAARNGLREGGDLCHDPLSAISFGNRTRLEAAAAKVKASQPVRAH